MEVKFNLPLLPLRDIVVFPNMVIPLFVGRDKSITALNEVMKNEKKIILVTQKNSEVDDPKKNDVFTGYCVVCLCLVLVVCFSFYVRLLGLKSQPCSYSSPILFSAEKLCFVQTLE